MSDFIIDDNASIMVELLSPSGVQQVGLIPTELAEQSVEALDSAMNAIYHMSRRLKATIDALTEGPSQVEVSFGLKLTAGVGALIAKAQTEAAISVKLIWDREPKSTADPPAMSPSIKE